MASINYAQREITCKIVYYGCAMSGKTTNLEYIHQHVPAAEKGGLVSLSTQGDRTLFFDFLPLEVADIGGFKVKFQLYTVPGQVVYNATRRLVLRGVDGIVFVADSQWSKIKENVESFENMMENLGQYGYSLDTIPYVLQYNKQDLPAIAPRHYLDFTLNRRQRRVPVFETVATEGHAVFDCLNAICQLVLAKLRAA
ncbi:MAG: GTP-binding protein [Candidatus Zipacnadales bacterium]